MVTFFHYVPTRWLGTATVEERFMHYTLLSFKDGERNAQDWAIRLVGNALAGKDRQGTVLVCIPGHDRATTERRYARFSEEVCMVCGCENGLPYVHVESSTKPNHLRKFHTKEQSLANVSVDGEFFKGRNVIVFDDITTTGRTCKRMAEILQEAGAVVIGAVVLAKTIRPKPK